jgi:DNA-binding transcriptional regulator YiaG
MKQNFSIRLRALKGKRTTQDLARALGVPKRTLDDWLVGRSVPAAITREAVLSKLQKTIREFPRPRADL